MEISKEKEDIIINLRRKIARNKVKKQWKEKKQKKYVIEKERKLKDHLLKENNLKKLARKLKRTR